MKFNFSLSFIFILFCVSYTIFDISGSLVSLLNKSGGGVLASNSIISSLTTKKDTNSVIITINLPVK